jgi:hypothetical protein
MPPSALKARAIEALVGAAVGTAAGGFAGGKTYNTKKPRHWIAGDRIYTRDLSGAEKKEFAKRLLTSAAVGAGAGSGLSLLGSTIRRKMLGSADLKEVQDQFTTYFGSLNRAVNRAEALNTRVGAGRGSYEDILRQLREYRDKTTPDLFLDRAKEYRRHAPWGGPATTKTRLPGPMSYSPVDGSVVPTVQDLDLPGPATAHGQMIREMGLRNLGIKVDPKTGRVSGHLKRHEAPADMQGPGGIAPGFWHRKLLGLTDGQ